MPDEPAPAASDDELHSYLAAISAEPGQSGLTGRFGSAQVFGIRLPAGRTEQLRELASARGVEPTTLIVDWVLERLDAENVGRHPSSSAYASVPSVTPSVPPSVPSGPSAPSGPDAASGYAELTPEHRGIDHQNHPLSPVDVRNHTNSLPAGTTYAGLGAGVESTIGPGPFGTTNPGSAETLEPAYPLTPGSRPPVHVAVSSPPPPVDSVGQRSEPAEQLPALPGSLTPLADSLASLLGSQPQSTAVPPTTLPSTAQAPTAQAPTAQAPTPPSTAPEPPSAPPNPPAATESRAPLANTRWAPEPPGSVTDSAPDGPVDRAHRPSDSFTPLADSLASLLGSPQPSSPRPTWMDAPAPTASAEPVSQYPAPSTSFGTSTPFASTSASSSVPRSPLVDPATWRPEPSAGYAEISTGSAPAAPSGTTPNRSSRHEPGDEPRDTDNRVIPIFRAGSELPNPDEHRGPRHRAPEPVISLLTRRKF